MVEKDPGSEDGPSLEMPKLGFGFLRRRKQDDQPETTDAESAAESEPEDAAEPTAEAAAPDPDPDTIFDEDEEPAETAAPDVPAVEEPELADAPPAADTPVIASPAEELGSEPADDPEGEDAAVESEDSRLSLGRWRKRRSPKAAEPPAPAAAVADTADPPEAAPEAEADADAATEVEAEAPAPEATSLTKTPEAAAEPAEEAPDPDTEATTVLTDVPETEAAEATEVLPGFSAAEPAAATEDQDEETPATAAKPKRTERTVSLPPLSGLTAAAVTGVAVGLLAVLLTFLALRGCEQARGTSSCGGPGLFLLIAIMVICVLAGRFLLAAWDVTDPGSTSFLAVGLLAVIALLFLVNVLFEWWMIILIPLIGMATYMLSHWVTTALIEPADRD